ncbi:ribose-phosphate diphosphokinase [Kiritimatiella glycovorans]|uniref:Ribose-phosphate pyrophosphokinase n=1 Tax=Kiritimatiella glycovorans TaxID=1307763 RepID=A0A0G3EGA3_9BACT|nr:ribose-phosphate pyrophosphokinase [Kiritimatiella glycovorans]AKJ64437.1 Ribose-phosphate pyrophosphokinase [Kiritimatiella glycovorans]
MKILAGTAHRDLAERIAGDAGAELGHVEISRFPDGEVFVKIKDNVRGADLFIIQPLSYPPNESLMELLIMIDAAKRASANRITAVLPFYGYARQDRKDQPRVPITAKLVANLLVAAGANRLLTVDLHAQQIQGFFDIPVDHLYASPIIVRHLRAKRNLKNLVVVSPDPGGLKMAYGYARQLEAGLALIGKQRKSSSDVESAYLVGEVQDCDTLIVDDIVSTAGTLSGAAQLLKDSGARSIRAAVTHSLLCEKGVERIRASAIEELITTDSVPQRIQNDGFDLTILSLSELLAEAICRIHKQQSVSCLFRVEE